MSYSASMIFNPPDPPSGYLQGRDFNRTFLAAAIIHVSVFIAILFWPQDEVQEIPVRTLHVTLGGTTIDADAPDIAQSEAPARMPELNDAAGQMPEKPANDANAPKIIPAEQVKLQVPKEPSYQPPAEHVPSPPKAKPAVKPKPKAAPKPDALPKVTRKKKNIPAPVNPKEKRIKIKDNPQPKKESAPKRLKEQEKRIKVPEPTPKVTQTLQAPVNRITPTLPSQWMPIQPRQFVRPGELSSPASGNSAPLTAAARKQIKKRYERTISMHLLTYKFIPQLAKQLGQHGEPIVRLRLDRRGRVAYYAIDRSSGYQVIDQAALEMVRRAQPFPPPPANYPGEQLIEFLMPIQFPASFSQ